MNLLYLRPEGGGLIPRARDAGGVADHNRRLGDLALPLPLVLYRTWGEPGGLREAPASSNSAAPAVPQMWSQLYTTRGSKGGYLVSLRTRPIRYVDTDHAVRMLAGGRRHQRMTRRLSVFLFQAEVAFRV